MPWTTKVTFAGRPGRKNLATVEAEFTDGNFKYTTTKKGVEVDDASELEKFKTVLAAELLKAFDDHAKEAAAAAQLTLLLNS